MVSINTNLSSLIAQRSMSMSTDKLNQAIERLTTGYKINHASDNAANYSILTNMSTQLSSYDIAADNIAMGMDLLSTAQDTIAGMQERGSRLHALITQARNGTYGADSLAAMTSEANAIMSEITRIYQNTEYNGMSIFDKVDLPDWAQEIKATAGTSDGKSLEQCASEHNRFIDTVDTATPQVTVTDPNQLASAISSNSIIGIGNAETLAKLADLVNAGTTCSGKTIVLTEDVDIASICAANTDANGYGGWTPIGNSSKKFQGIFNGNGHKVTGLYINRETFAYQGLFGYTTNVIKNISVEGVNINGLQYTGGLVGHATGTITNCYSTGDVIGCISVGGLAGLAYAVTNCYSTCNVNGFGSDCAGGLVGEAYYNVTNCYATGSVTGTYLTGGLIGYAEGYVTNCYATGNITSNDNYTGGLVGYLMLDVVDSYATGDVTGQGTSIGSLVGIGAITNSYATGIVTANGITTSGHNFYNNSGVKSVFEGAATTLQVGINSGADSQIVVNTNLQIGLSISNLTSDSALTSVENFLNQLSQKSTELGAAQNRLESALESTLVQMDNLTSSLSTIRDADIAQVSSQYIRQQILQQAAATLLSTANQTPAIALQLL